MYSRFNVDKLFYAFWKDNDAKRIHCFLREWVVVSVRIPLIFVINSNSATIWMGSEKRIPGRRLSILEKIFRDSSNESLFESLKETDSIAMRIALRNNARNRIRSPEGKVKNLPTNSFDGIYFKMTPLKGLVKDFNQKRIQ